MHALSPLILYAMVHSYGLLMYFQNIVCSNQYEYYEYDSYYDHRGVY